MFRLTCACAAAALALAACSQSASVPATAESGSQVAPQSASAPVVSQTLGDRDAPRYRLVLLGSGLVPAKINGLGVIVGTDVNIRRPFVYKFGRLRYLQLFPGDAVGGANDINNSDEIVGYTQSTDNNGLMPMHAVSWADGHVTNLGATAGYDIPATNIAEVVSDSGEIAGESGLSASGGVIPLAIFAPGSVRRIGTATGELFGINDSGEIVGVDILPLTDVASPFAYPNPIACVPSLAADAWILGINDAGDTISSNLSPPSLLCVSHVGRTLSMVALGINDRDDVVGDSAAVQPMLYANGTLSDARALAASHPDVRLSNTVHLRGVRAYSSRDGAVHGVMLAVSSGDAVLYVNGHVYDLNDLVPHHPGVVLQNAVSINHRREIVGTATVNGSLAGYLLVPIDEPE